MGITRDSHLCLHGLYVYHLCEDHRKRKCHHAAGATPDDVPLGYFHAFRSPARLFTDGHAVHPPYLPGRWDETCDRRQPVALRGNNRFRGSLGRHHLLPDNYSEEVQVGVNALLDLSTLILRRIFSFYAQFIEINCILSVFRIINGYGKIIIRKYPSCIKKHA